MLVIGISISHRRHVVRYTGGKTKMGIQNVRRGRQRSHRYSRDDENRSGTDIDWLRKQNASRSTLFT